MENLHPILSFVLILFAFAISCYVIFIGSELLIKNPKDPSHQALSFSGSKTGVRLSIRSTGGILLVISGLMGIVTILYLYWMIALPLLLACGGGAVAKSKMNQM